MTQTEINSIIEAAGLFNGILHKLLVSRQGLHAETLIASAARMSGTMLVRGWLDAGNGPEPGATLLSGQADRQGPGLVDALLQTLHRLGHPQVGDRGFGDAALSTDLSRLSLAQTQTLLEPWYRKTQQLSGLSDQAAAMAGAVSTAMQIHQCRDVIDVEAACGLAVNGLVESMKTVPVSLAPA
jgi:hypothetical protein